MAKPARGKPRSAPKPAPAERRGRDAKSRAALADFRRHLVVHPDTKADPDGGDPPLGMARIFADLGAEATSLPELSSKALVFETWHVRHPERTSAELIDLLREKHNVFAERNARARLHALPAVDPMFAEQWAWPHLGAEAAWRRTAGAAAPVTVAIVDSGVFARHQDLPRATISGVAVGGVAQPFDVDEEGHGTMLAGTIAAVTGNAVGGAGAAGRTGPRWLKLFAAKFFDTRIIPTAAAAAVAIEAAADAGAAVINASWDVGIDPSLVLRKAIRAAAGSLIVISAGNDGTDNDRYPTIPAAYAFEHVAVVLATDRADGKTDFSNFGTSVDLGAPGQDIATTHPYIRPPPPFRAGRFNPAYREFGGTSSAAAFVTGAAALLKHADPGWTPAELKAHLAASAEPVAGLAAFCRAGGRLSLERAVCGPAAVTAPAGGERFIRGTAIAVRCDWRYRTPALQTVRIELAEGPNAPAQVLLAGQAPAPSYSVTLPNRAVASARLRVIGEQRRLFAESGAFRIA